MNKPVCSNDLLGYPADARLLIINADDFGMCHSVNSAVIQALPHGVVHSTTLMVPCAASADAMQFLRDQPQFPFGIHLTAVSDSESNCWKPLSPAVNVPSLVDDAGVFLRFEHMQEMLARLDLRQLELEFRTQIEGVLAAGLHPHHLDWHSLRISHRPDIFEVMFRLAREYKLALRVMEKSLMERLLEQGLPAVDTYFLDSSQFDSASKPDCFARLLRELPAGLTEWALHPGLDGAELDAIEPTGNHFRQKDFEFLTSKLAKELIEEEGIILLDYRALQQVWQQK